MKKLLTVLAVFGIIAASLTVVGTALAQGVDPGDDFPGGRGGRSGHGGQAGPAEDSPLHGLILAELANAFSVSVEDLQAQLDAGETMSDIAAGYGYDFETFRALMDEIMVSVRETAIAEGFIPEDTGSRFGSGQNFGSRGGFMGNSEIEGYMHDAIAELLGLTPEELQARIDAGKTMADITAELGFSPEEISSLMQTARTNALQAAVDAGLLTQEQADMMLERGPGGPGHFRQGHNQQP